MMPVACAPGADCTGVSFTGVTVTATLPGFVTVRRAEVELSGSQTLTIPIEMRIGGLAETMDQPVSGLPFASVEAQVERTLAIEGKAALAIRQLVAGKAQVQQHAIDRLNL